MKKFLSRVALVLKYGLAIFVDFVFPIVDLLQAILLILPIPGLKAIVVASQKYEEIAILWVDKIKQIKDAVEDAEKEVEK